ncbi:MAG: hypothetical protein WD118_07120 [Phycisphaeraceae bacterium]
MKHFLVNRLNLPVKTTSYRLVWLRRFERGHVAQSPSPSSLKNSTGCLGQTSVCDFVEHTSLFDEMAMQQVPQPVVEKLWCGRIATDPAVLVAELSEWGEQAGTASRPSLGNE